jgi:predicted neuraminidase
VLSVWVATSPAAEPVYKSEFVFAHEAQSHGHVHASTIIECPNGDLRVVWYENGPKLDEPRYYNARNDKSDDVRIAGSRKSKGASAWETPFVMSDTFGVSDNNPTMVIDGEGRLWLFHSTMLGAPKWSWGSSLLRFKVSSNYESSGPPIWERDGLLIPHPLGFDKVFDRLAAQLSAPEADKRFGISKARGHALLNHLRTTAEDAMKLRLGWMPRAHPLVRSDGALIVPLSNENFAIPMMALTSDAGQTWTYSDPVPGIGLIQPTLVEFPDGEITAFFRNGDPRHRIKRSTSTDGGMTWSTPTLTDLPHPGGGIEALLLKSGHLAMVYNNKETKPRDKLAISLSDDGGRTWKWTRQLEDTPGGRFDYPSIVQAADGMLHVTYSHQLKTIKHVTFNEEWVREMTAE